MPWQSQQFLAANQEPPNNKSHNPDNHPASGEAKAPTTLTTNNGVNKNRNELTGNKNAGSLIPARSSRQESFSRRHCTISKGGDATRTHRTISEETNRRITSKSHKRGNDNPATTAASKIKRTTSFRRGCGTFLAYNPDNHRPPPSDRPGPSTNHVSYIRTQIYIT